MELTPAQMVVEECVAILDEQCPAWRAFVDADRLDLQSVVHCILAQIGVKMYHLDRNQVDGRGPWTQMTYRLGLHGNEAFEKGGFADNRYLEAWKEIL